jgi:restriction system protein
MADVPLWFVRAGEKGWLAERFLTQGIVAIGWHEAAPISAETSDEEVDRLFAEHLPNTGEGARSVWASQVKRFLREIRIGDEVMTYDPRERSYLIGRVESDAEWLPGDHPRQRRVTWTHRVSRDALSENTRNRLGSIATLFRVADEPRTELLQNLAPLDGGPVRSVVRAEEGPALSPEDFSVLERNQRSVPWPRQGSSDWFMAELPTGLWHGLLQPCIQLRSHPTTRKPSRFLLEAPRLGLAGIRSGRQEGTTALQKTML